MVLGAYSLVASHDDKVCWAASKISDAELTQDLTILLFFFLVFVAVVQAAILVDRLQERGYPLPETTLAKLLNCAPDAAAVEKLLETEVMPHNQPSQSVWASAFDAIARTNAFSLIPGYARAVGLCLSANACGGATARKARNKPPFPPLCWPHCPPPPQGDGSSVEAKGGAAVESRSLAHCPEYPAQGLATPCLLLCLFCFVVFLS